MLKKYALVSLIGVHATFCALAGYTWSANPELKMESGDNHVELLELFSSQGCSSCPPAERWMSGFVQDKGLWREFVPVVFHVDYWDYLGWTDRFASADYSARQQRYKMQSHSNAIYTPGFMLDGREWRQWFSSHKLPAFDNKQPVGNLTITISGNQIDAKFSRDRGPENFVLNVVLLGFEINTTVRAGENRGKQLKQDFVVLKFQSWKSETANWRVPMPATDFTGKQAIACWVSEEEDLTPIQAVGGWLN